MATEQRTNVEFDMGREKAKQRSRLYDDLAKGEVKEGLTDEISKIASDAQQGLQKQAEKIGAKPVVKDAADVLEAQRLLIEKKDLADRFLRIGNRLSELQARYENDPAVEDFIKQMESMRSILRQTVRSSKFRDTVMEAFLVFRSVISEEAEKVADKAADKVEKEVKKKGTKGAAKEGVEKLREGAGKVQERAKEAQKDLKKGQIPRDIISDEEWTKLLDKLDHLFSRLNSHAEYRKGVRQLFDLGSSMVEKVSNLDIPKDSAVDSIQKETKDLLAQFAGDELDTLIGRIRGLSSSIQKNSDIQKWWKSFKDQVFKVAESYQGKEDLERFRSIFDEGRKLFNNYRPRINDIIDSVQTIMDNITNDKYVSKLRESLSSLTDDLVWTDKEGNRYFDSDAAGELLSSIGAVMRERFSYFVLPRVVHKDSSSTYTLDNLVLTATLPDKIDFHLETDLSLDVSKVSDKRKSALATEIYITTDIKGISAQAKDISFTYEGYALSDSGVMDVTISDADLSIDFILKPTTSAEDAAGILPGGVRYEFLRVKSNFVVNEMNINFHEETLTHSLLLPLLVNFFHYRIIDRFESGINRALDEGLIELGRKVAYILNQSPYPLSVSSFGSLWK